MAILPSLRPPVVPAPLAGGPSTPALLGFLAADVIARLVRELAAAR